MIKKLHELNLEELINTFVEIELEDNKFLTIRETLTRMGIPKINPQTLFQSCHILQKRGKYYIVHFKELFALDGRQVEMESNDYARRNTIANMLQDWDLCKIISTENANDIIFADISAALTIIQHSEKDEWILQPKYSLGK